MHTSWNRISWIWGKRVMKGKEHKENGDKYSLRGRVYDRIREDILNGVYKEHEELKEATLGKMMDVSRTPVREALRQLELEGLVEIIPNKGARVTGIPRRVHAMSMAFKISSSVSTVIRPFSYSLSTHTFISAIIGCVFSICSSPFNLK